VSIAAGYDALADKDYGFPQQLKLLVMALEVWTEAVLMIRGGISNVPLSSEAPEVLESKVPMGVPPQFPHLIIDGVPAAHCLRDGDLCRLPCAVSCGTGWSNNTKTVSKGRAEMSLWCHKRLFEVTTEATLQEVVQENWTGVIGGIAA
jgi:hypothetical protein